ncbi:MAG: PD-(D/E)XK nuclease family transposase [Lachnospiraceae bacterium]|nr:PD-(D/E)XK nuclease family transposase [Lachnospiraceae bacterium]
MSILTLEEKREKIKELRPIDDVFFEALADDIKVCQEILRVILEDPKLTVEDVIVQSSKRNLYGRSVRLDALCTLGNGTKCNIEVQRSDNDNHLKRVRFNAASITVKDSNPNESFDDVLDMYVVYISEFDIFKEGKTIYHVDKVLRETGTIVDDGLQMIFVNTEIHDGSEIAELMKCFLQKEIHDEKFPETAKRMAELKTTEGGVGIMCKIMEEYLEASKAEGIAEGIAKGKSEGIAEGKSIGKLEQLIELVKDGLLKAADAAVKAGMTEQEFTLLLK